MSAIPKRIITVFGTSAAADTDPVFHAGVEMGRMLARKGFEIANGGYGGTMRAVAKGASSVGAKVYGVTCSAFKRGKANEFVTDEIKTENLNGRLEKLIAMGDGYIALPGGTGTLLELAWVWEHKNKGFQTAGKPIVLLGDFWKPLIEIMKQADSDCGNCIYEAQTPQQAADYLAGCFSDREEKT
jgi:uncharacterized protein (TIGR00730 family)